MTAVIYARYSTDSQREESIEGQIRECTAYAEKNGFTVVKHYIDRAVSAKTDNRPQFQQMIKDSERGIFDVIIVWKLDRFARNRYDSARYKTQLKRNGVKLVSATEVISAGPEGIILESVLEGYAEYYSADLSEKVVRGMTENALKGIYNGGTIPFGYMIDETRHYQPDPLLAPYVEQTFQKYADGATPTPASDVYAVGRLFYALLDPTAANNLRLGRDLSFLERYVTLTASQARPSGLEGSLLAQVNALLTAAAKKAPEERITLEEMARQMDEWRRRLTPPVWSLAQNAGALNDGEVKGHDEDVKNLLNELENEKRNPHVLWGFAGMGKTKLALAAAHGWQQRHPLSRTYFVRFPGTLEALYTDTFAHAMPVERGGPDLIGDVQKLLCENLSELDLLVIDNFDRDEASSWAELTGASGSLEQQLYQQLCALPCRLLLTTRQNLEHAAGGRFFEINSLKEDVLLDILRDGSRGLPDSDDDTLRHILRLVERHTMTITMVAALMQFTHIPAGQIAEDLSKGQTLRDNSLEMLIPSEKDGESRSGTVLQNLTTLFGLAKLTPPMRTLLHRAMFIGESGLSRELFLNACGLRPDDRDFHALVDLRYLNSTGSGKDECLVPHTLIRKLCSLREPGG